MSDRYAVIGNPIGHSRSPLIQGMFAAQTGQDLVFETLLAPLGGFAQAVADFAAAGGRGLSVTVPFKQQAFQLGGRVSARALAVKAVNTLSLDGDAISLDNTDGTGLVRDLLGELGCEIKGRRVLLLGAGGAARGVLRPLAEEGPRQLAIANRSADKAEALAREFSTAELAIAGCGFVGLDGQSFDLVINATSAGLSGSSLDLPAGLFASGSLAYDMVYGRDTPFMRQAREGGAGRVVDGLGMLVEGAAESFFIWRGVRPDTAAVRRQLRQDAPAQR